MPVLVLVSVLAPAARDAPKAGMSRAEVEEVAVEPNGRRQRDVKSRLLAQPPASSSGSRCKKAEPRGRILDKSS